LSQPKNSLEVLLADTMAINDTLKSDPSILNLIVQHLGPTLIIRPVYRQLNNDKTLTVTEADCKALGLTLVEPSYEDDVGVINCELKELGETDLYCLFISKRLGCTCITNDAALIRACKLHGVRFMRTLRPLLILAESGIITEAHALSVVDDMLKNDAWIAPKHVATFKRMLRMASSKVVRKKPG
jgi:hypothetical protein